jgi:hypothetical protein
MLSDQFTAGLAYAHEAHKTQARKGTQVPYVAHLLATAALVLEDGGGEIEAIAALLHDAVEDQGGRLGLRTSARSSARTSRISWRPAATLIKIPSLLGVHARRHMLHAYAQRMRDACCVSSQRTSSRICAVSPTSCAVVSTFGAASARDALTNSGTTARLPQSTARRVSASYPRSWRGRWQKRSRPLWRMVDRSPGPCARKCLCRGLSSGRAR